MTGQTIDRHTISRKSAGGLYRTGVGHYNVTEGRNYWYLTDRAGSTVAVMNDSTVVQRNGYYASGTPLRYSVKEYVISRRYSLVYFRLRSGKVYQRRF